MQYLNENKPSLTNQSLAHGNIQDFHALSPIPASEIEVNKDAKLEQNPGY